MNLVIFGPPGAGKGTQSKFISNKYNLHQLSTGELLRDEIKNKTPLGFKISSMFTQGQPLYMLLYASGIIFFAFFYTSIVFNPKETAENLRKYGGYIPGIRPGERTAEYIESILIRLTTVGSLYLTFVCLMPEFLIAKYPIPFYLGGTSILIVVVVAMDTVTQVQTRLMSSQYESLIRKTKFGK